MITESRKPKEIAEIVEDIKGIICVDMTGPVFDYNVALALGMTSGNLAQAKKRNRIPYAEIINFGLQNGVSIDYLLTRESGSWTSDYLKDGK